MFQESSRGVALGQFQRARLSAELPGSLNLGALQICVSVFLCFCRFTGAPLEQKQFALTEQSCDRPRSASVNLQKRLCRNRNSDSKPSRGVFGPALGRRPLTTERKQRGEETQSQSVAKISQCETGSRLLCGCGCSCRVRLQLHFWLRSYRYCLHSIVFVQRGRAGRAHPMSAGNGENHILSVKTKRGRTYVRPLCLLLRS